MMVRNACFAISFAVFCGCASNRADTDKDAAPLASGQEACFQATQVTGFRPLDRSNLIVYAPTKSRAYHVRIRPPARELSFTSRIAFDGQGTRICGHAGDGVIFDTDSMARKYFVTAVYRLDAEGAQSLIDEYSEELIIDSPDDPGAEIDRDIEDDE
jgi:hypothetical protein